MHQLLSSVLVVGRGLGVKRGFGAKWILKMATNSLRTGSERVFEHPEWSTVIFENPLFWPQCDLFAVPKWAV